MRATPLLVVLASVLATLSACGAAVPPATSTPPSPPSPDAGPVASASAQPPPDKPARDAGLVLPLCGCALCKPVVSEDACTTDADCAPATPCHAEACVAKAKAVAKRPDTMCTMILRCDSVDANTCGCLEGRCALYPPKK